MPAQVNAVPPYPEAIAIRVGARFVVVRAAHINWIEADGAYVRVHVRGEPARVLTRSLGMLERQVLDPQIFVRVHRSAIVNTRHILAVEPRDGGGLMLLLQDGARVECSRRRRHALEQLLHFAS